MKCSQQLRLGVVMLTALGLMSAPLAAGEARVPTAAVDVALGPQGTLQGQLVNPQGKALGGSAVRVHRVGGDAVVAKTDAHGRFQVRGLRAGQYILTANDKTMTLRAWQAQVAPPAALKGLLVVDDATAVRGQLGLFPDWRMGVMVVTGVAAGAIGFSELDGDDPVDTNAAFLSQQTSS